MFYPEKKMSQFLCAKGLVAANIPSWVKLLYLQQFCRIEVCGSDKSVTLLDPTVSFQIHWKYLGI